MYIYYQVVVLCDKRITDGWLNLNVIRQFRFAFYTYKIVSNVGWDVSDIFG